MAFPTSLRALAQFVLALTADVADYREMPYFTRDLAADAVGLLDHFNITAAHVVGYDSVTVATVFRIVRNNTATQVLPPWRVHGAAYSDRFHRPGTVTYPG